MRTTLEQVKSLGIITASRDIKVDEADQLMELYMIKSKHDICMFETNLNNFSEGNKSQVDLKKQKPKNDIREEIKYTAIRIIYFQSKALKVHAEKLKENLNYALKEANDSKLA